MGTRSLTIFRKDIDDLDTEVCVLYRQMDGYPTGQGADLKECLDNASVGNGIPGDLEDVKFFNGFGDLVPQTIARLKNKQAQHTQKMRAEFALHGLSHPRATDGNMEPGGFYMYAPGTNDLWEEYTYVVHLKDDKVCIRVYGHSDILYDGLIDDFNPREVEALEREEDSEEE